MRNNLYKWIPWAVVFVVVVIFPHFTGIYYTNFFVRFAIFALYAVSLNLLLGYMGVLSFGHAMFFGTGAYMTALALTHIEGFPLIPAVLVGGLTGAVLALILSPLMVRVSGTAFAMLSLAFSQLIFVAALKYREVTGGEDGVGGFPIPPFNIPGIVSFDMTDQVNFYYFAVIVVAICLLIVWFYTKSPFGSLIVGIRDNAMRIDYLGFKLSHTKGVNLIVSGVFAGIAGALYALLQNLVSTVGVLDLHNCFLPLMMAYIGGVGHFLGPVLGSAILHILEDIVFRFTERIGLINGAIFIVVVLFAPMGVVGLLGMVKARWFTKTVNQMSAETSS